MTAQLFRLQLWSFRNRLLTRIRRLRQIRYLTATIVGAAYILFVWKPYRAVNILDKLREKGGAAPADILSSFEIGIGALLMVIALLRWLWPGSKPVLDFSEAEVAFLFPAPLTRGQLVRYSLLRSQVGILFGVFMLTFFGVGRIAPSFPAAFAGVWVAMATLQLHFLASTIVRSNLIAHGKAGFRRSWPVLAAGTTILILIVVWAVFWLRQPMPSETSRLDRYMTEMLASGPMGWLIMPGRLLIRPALAADLRSFTLAILPALALLLLNYLWVIRSDFAFEEASAERASTRAAERASRAMTGRRGKLTVRAGARAVPFNLAPSGRPEVAILWKNLIATSRLLSLRHLLIFSAPALVIVLAAVQSGGKDWQGLLHAVGSFCLIFAGILVLVGPGIVRSDLRMDLRMIDLLKSYPLAGRALVLGEVTAPVCIITLLQALLLAVAVPLMSGAAGWSAVEWAAVAIGALVLAGPLNLITSLVQNAALLTFPSWHRIGLQRSRGIEAFGQVLIAGVLRLLVLALTFLPTTVILAVGIFLAYPRFGIAVAPFLALAAAIPALIEGWMGLEALGLFFERFDPSKEIDVPT